MRRCKLGNDLAFFQLSREQRELRRRVHFGALNSMGIGIEIILNLANWDTYTYAYQCQHSPMHVGKQGQRVNISELLASGCVSWST